MFWYLRNFTISDSLRTHLNEFLRLFLIWVFVSTLSVIEIKAYGTSINILKDNTLNKFAYILLAAYGFYYLIRFLNEYFAFARMRSWNDVPDSEKPAPALIKDARVEAPISAIGADVRPANADSNVLRSETAAKRHENIETASNFSSIALQLFELIAPLSMTFYAAYIAAT